MINPSIISPLTSALLGAICAGILNTLANVSARERERQSILKALAADVGILTWIIRHQYHPARLRLAASEIEAGRPARIAVAPSFDYFRLFGSLGADIGRLSAKQTVAITQFYKICKIVIDTLGQHSPYKDYPQNMRFAAWLLETVLRLGDHIQKMPKEKSDLDLLGKPFDWPAALGSADEDDPPKL